MTIEWIETPEGKVQILYGYGRIQKIRFMLYSLMPESIKRAQIANPSGDDAELMSKASPEDIIAYKTKAGVEIAKLVLNEAPDWDKSKMSVEEFVDSCLSEVAGDKIFARVQSLLSEAQIAPEKKKDSS